MTDGQLTVAAFASGRGTNFQALLDHQDGGDVPWRVGVLVCNREAAAMDLARAAGVRAVVIPTKGRDPVEVGRETLDVLGEQGVDVIALAGYLRLLPPAVVERYAGRIVNIHPALLPEFGGEGMYGMNVHRAVVEAGVGVTGATVHFVDEKYDEGAILGQWQIPLRPHDTPEDVAARVLRVEHELYPRALDHLCAALAAGDDVATMDVVRLEHPPQSREEVR